ncbi:TIGR04282 family arsenosugar biosynthesis glycosyltransferase [Reyranella sp.]|uniref:TIGR04282 family arsenosugar biosynthesis glycosyltransferase n=1 Tax=Reyranella sp. TaxID=1929291 RepID=UPI0040369F08
MKRHLVIFARTPQAGRVKRRLGAAIGMREAVRFYRRILGDQIRRMTLDPRWTVWLFVTPDNTLGHPAWHLVPVSRRKPQRQGDLGRRMKLPFASLPPGPVVLVGSDIPEMRASHIARAFALLGAHDLVFGPARDGGFWLVGARRVRPLPRSLFARVRWSIPTALADTLAGLPDHITVALADTLEDVDDAEALRRLAG